MREIICFKSEKSTLEEKNFIRIWSVFSWSSASKLSNTHFQYFLVIKHSYWKWTLQNIVEVVKLFKYDHLLWFLTHVQTKCNITAAPSRRLLSEKCRRNIDFVKKLSQNWWKHEEIIVKINQFILCLTIYE